MNRNNWIPTSSGLLPDDNEDVQVTYLGFEDGKPYCNEFAYVYDGKWHWSSDGEISMVKITAWRYNNDPYVGN